MAKLPPPRELLDLLGGEEIVTRVTGFVEGDIDITVRRTGEAKTVGALRITVPPEDKPTVPSYWDLTSTLLLAHMRPLLPQVVTSGRYIRIKKQGEAPYARFEFAIMPDTFHGPAHIGAHR
jgi:hypothetical protein